MAKTSCDVAVIGGGVAGVVAALAAREAGARVVVARRGWGASALASGAWEVAWQPAVGAWEGPPRSIRHHLEDIVAHRPRHPFAALGQRGAAEEIVAGQALLRRALAALPNPSVALPEAHLDAAHAWFPATTGLWVPTSGSSGGDGAHAFRGRWGVWEVPRSPYVRAARIIAGLMAGPLPPAEAGGLPEWTSVAADVPGPTPQAMARALEDEATLAGVARALAPQLAGATGLLAPPILGLGDHLAVRARLEAALGMPVRELVAHLPSVPGFRLQRALDAVVAAAGIPVVGALTAVTRRGGQVVDATADDGQALVAGAWVLASGKFTGGGIATTRRPREALMGLPVVSDIGKLTAEGLHNTLRQSPVESQPLFTAGVRVNARLQPFDEGSRPVDNVFAAGMVLGGFASRFCRCADGVAVATGGAAARAAVEQAGAGRLGARA